jgi:DNA-binding Lrp family transcriptional regulator
VTSLTLGVLDRKIIHALYIDARVPFSRMAAVLGASEQTVARRYRRLREAGVVRVVGQLDSQRLGQSDWVVRIRCTPDGALPVATALAKRPDTTWVQLISGGTEVFGTIKSHDERERTALLLQQLPSHRKIVGVEAQWLLHPFSGSPSLLPGADELEPREVEQLRQKQGLSALVRDRGQGMALAPEGNRAARPQDDDWPLLRALAEDGRATYRELAAQTHWHESTVRRRVEELVAAGTLYFDLDVMPEALGLGARAILWMSVAPSHLMDVGQALKSHPEVPFVAATTGSANLIATLACRDTHGVFSYLTDQIARLEGVTRIETAPVMRSVKMHATMVRGYLQTPGAERTVSPD